MNSELVQYMHSSIVVLDEQDRIASMNNSAETLLEVSFQRACGSRFPDLMVELDHIVNAIAQARSDEQSVRIHHAHLYLGNATDEQVDYSVSPVPNPPGHLVIELRVLGPSLRLSRDEQQAHAQAAAQELIRGLAHEIKNPLGGLRGAAQQLARELPDPDLAEFTDIIISEADRLRDLVDRMLDTQAQPIYAPVNIHQVLERVVRLTKAEHPTLKIARDYDPSIPELLADRNQLIQAVLNIVTNARQAFAQPLPEDAQITLRTRVLRQFTIGQTRHRLAVQLEIIDNGPGIPLALQEQLFFPMISGRADGTGLGLSITRTVITQHNGSIEFDTRPGRTAFRINLPFEPPTDQGATC